MRRRKYTHPGSKVDADNALVVWAVESEVKHKVSILKNKSIKSIWIKLFFEADCCNGVISPSVKKKDKERM